MRRCVPPAAAEARLRFPSTEDIIVVVVVEEDDDTGDGRWRVVGGSIEEERLGPSSLRMILVVVDGSSSGVKSK